MEQLQITGGFLKDTSGKYIADLTTNSILRDLAPGIVQAVNSHNSLWKALLAARSDLSRLHLHHNETPSDEVGKIINAALKLAKGE